MGLIRALRETKFLVSQKTLTYLLYIYIWTVGMLLGLELALTDSAKIVDNLPEMLTAAAGAVVGFHLAAFALIYLFLILVDVVGSLIQGKNAENESGIAAARHIAAGIFTIFLLFGSGAALLMFPIGMFTVATNIHVLFTYDLNLEPLGSLIAGLLYWFGVGWSWRLSK